MFVTILGCHFWSIEIYMILCENFTCLYFSFISLQILWWWVKFLWFFLIDVENSIMFRVCSFTVQHAEDYRSTFVMINTSVLPRMCCLLQHNAKIYGRLLLKNWIQIPGVTSAKYKKQMLGIKYFHDILKFCCSAHRSCCLGCRKAVWQVAITRMEEHTIFISSHCTEGEGSTFLEGVILTYQTTWSKCRWPHCGNCLLWFDLWQDKRRLSPKHPQWLLRCTQPNMQWVLGSFASEVK